MLPKIPNSSPMMLFMLSLVALSITCSVAQSGPARPDAPLVTFEAEASRTPEPRPTSAPVLGNQTATPAQPSPDRFATAAAATVAVQLTEVAGEASDADLSLIPVRYTLEDVGDGWNQGTVWLAFENRTREVIRTMGLGSLGEIVVETQEGPTYPGILAQPWAPLETHGGEVDQLRFYRELWIPPQFRFLVDADGQSYMIQWRSALAATPLQITFPSRPALSFSLPPQEASLPTFPFDEPPVPMSEFSSLSGVALIMEQGGIEAAFTGRCGTGEDLFGDRFVGPSFWLEFQAQNTDQFNEHTASYLFLHSLFDLEGGMWQFWNPTRSSPAEYTMGPGVSKTDYVNLVPEWQFEGKAKLYVVLWTEGSAEEFTIFDTSRCSLNPSTSNEGDTRVSVETWRACPNAPLSRLHVGDFATVTYDPPHPNRVRDKPNSASGKVVGMIDPGEEIEILDGPVCNNRYVWWKARSLESGLTGWTAEGDQESYWLNPKE